MIESWKQSGLIAVAVAIAVLIGGGLQAWSLGHAAPAVAEQSDLAHSLGTELLAIGPTASVESLGPGTEYHLVERVYRRYGPAASEIQATPGNGPETQISESIVVFDKSGMESSLSVDVRDQSGILQQRTQLDGGQFVNVNAATNVRTVLGGVPQTAEQFQLAARQRNQAQAQKLLTGKATVIRRDASVVVIREEVAVPGIQTNSGNDPNQGYTIPYVRDLQAVSAYILTTLDATSLGSLKSEEFAVGKDGSVTLVESHEIISESARAGATH